MPVASVAARRRVKHTACVAPVVVSNVSTLIDNEHGARGVVVGSFSWTIARTKPRVPVMPDVENGRRAEDACPVVRVKLVAVPTAVPAAFPNERVPVHDSELSSLTGRKLN